MIDLDAAAQLAASAPSRPAGDFVWLHFNLSDAAAERWIAQNLEVAAEFFDALHEGSRSTRIEDAHDTLVAVVNDVAFEFAFDPSEIATLWVNVGPRMAITARARPLRSIDHLPLAVKEGFTFRSSVLFLDRLLHDQGDVLMRIVRQATLQVDDVEDRLLGGRIGTQRGDLGKAAPRAGALATPTGAEPGAFISTAAPAAAVDRRARPGRASPGDRGVLARDARPVRVLQEGASRLLQDEIAAQVGEHTNPFERT